MMKNDMRELTMDEMDVVSGGADGCKLVNQNIVCVTVINVPGGMIGMSTTYDSKSGQPIAGNMVFIPA